MAVTFEYSSEDWDNSSNKVINASDQVIQTDRSTEIQREFLFIYLDSVIHSERSYNIIKYIISLPNKTTSDRSCILISFIDYVPE